MLSPLFALVGPASPEPEAEFFRLRKKLERRLCRPSAGTSDPDVRSPGAPCMFCALTLRRSPSWLRRPDARLVLPSAERGRDEARGPFAESGCSPPVWSAGFALCGGRGCPGWAYMCAGGFLGANSPR